MTERDPRTGAKWPDRYGKAFGKGYQKQGNIEPFLSYKKLHRTGKLLRGIKVRVSGSRIVMSSSAPYTTEHEFGLSSGSKFISGQYVQGGVRGVVTGGRVHARPFMRPSKQVLRAPYKMVGDKMREFGW